MEAPRLSVIDTTTPERLFLDAIGEIVCVGEVIGEDEPPYVAKVLARYSTYCGPIPANDTALEVFSFLYGPPAGEGFDVAILRAAGDQSLFFGGFFYHQATQTGRVRFYKEFGPVFYKETSRLAKLEETRLLFQRMSENFEIWTYICHKLKENARLGFKPVRH